MTLTAPTIELRRATDVAREQIPAIVTDCPGIEWQEAYDAIADSADPLRHWRELAVRTAFWDLLVERKIDVVQGRRLFARAA
jgi:hypothetical protein